MPLGERVILRDLLTRPLIWVGVKGLKLLDLVVDIAQFGIRRLFLPRRHPEVDPQF